MSESLQRRARGLVVSAATSLQRSLEAAGFGKVSQDGGGPPPPGPCILTLVDGSTLDPVNFLPVDIVGQLVSITDSTLRQSPSYAAFTPTPVTVDWPANEVQLVGLNYGPAYSYEPFVGLNVTETPAYVVTNPTQDRFIQLRMADTGAGLGVLLIAGDNVNGIVAVPAGASGFGEPYIGFDTNVDQLAIGVDGAGFPRMFVNGREWELEYINVGGGGARIAPVPLFNVAEALTYAGFIALSTSDGSTEVLNVTTSIELLTNSDALDDPYPTYARTPCDDAFDAIRTGYEALSSDPPAGSGTAGFPVKDTAQDPQTFTFTPAADGRSFSRSSARSRRSRPPMVP